MDGKQFDIEAQAESISHCEPEPLHRPLPPPQAYPIDALGELLGKAAKGIQEAVQAPEALCGQAILTAASLAVQAHADVIIDGRIEPLSLWAVTVGESGERKSGVYNWALRAHSDYEKEMVRAYQDDLKAYKVKLSAYETACKQVTGGKAAKASMTGIYDDLRNVGAEPEPPLFALILMQEPTLEGVHKHLIGGQPSIGLFSDDGAEFTGGHAMNKDNRAKSAAGFSKLWDNGEFSRVRAGDGGGKYYGKRLALHLMIQPVIAESILSDSVLGGQGFLPRCLLAWPESKIGTRYYQASDLSADPDLVTYWHRVRELLEVKPALIEGMANELNPRRLTLSSEAKVLFKHLHDDIETATLGEYTNVKAWASKGAAQALRIAGVLTIFENPSANQIDEGTLDRARRLVSYYLGEAARLSGISTIPPEIRLAEALLDWMAEKGKQYIYSAEVIQYGPNQLRTQASFRKAIEPLIHSGHLIPVEGGMVLNGKHRQRAWQFKSPS